MWSYRAEQDNKELEEAEVHGRSNQTSEAIDEKGCNYDPNVDELLEKCTAAYNEPDHNFPMIYADYYFIEAIWKLTGDELFIW